MAYVHSRQSILSLKNETLKHGQVSKQNERKRNSLV